MDLGATATGRVQRFALAAPLAALVLAGGWLGQAASPGALPAANGRIAFQSNRDGDYEIYAVSPQCELGKHGTPAKRLTRNRAYDGYPAWSANGKQIAFTSFRDGNNEVYVMDVDGSHQKRLTNSGADDAILQPRISMTDWAIQRPYPVV